MKAIDYRNETYESLRGRVAGLRAVTLEALRRHGPCTTRELADRARIDPFTVRPRVTELCQMGFARLVDDGDESRREGRYRAATDAEARAAYEAARDEALGFGRPCQLELI